MQGEYCTEGHHVDGRPLALYLGAGIQRDAPGAVRRAICNATFTTLHTWYQGHLIAFDVTALYILLYIRVDLDTRCKVL